MSRYRVTETQIVQYTWFVEAEDEAAAIATADPGVPDDARSHLVDSQVEAELADEPN